MIPAFHFVALCIMIILKKMKHIVSIVNTQFGDDILVAPIGAPAVNGYSKVKVWLPEGNNWYEMAYRDNVNRGPNHRAGFRDGRISGFCKGRSNHPYVW